jgi:Neprosin
MNTRVILTSVGLVALAVGSQPVLAQNAPSQFVPYYTFLDNVRSVAPSAYVGQPGNLVRDTAEFEKMRQHILTMDGNAHVARSFVLEGNPWDCIPVMEQPSVRLLGQTEIASPPPYPPQTPGGGAPKSVPQIGPDEKIDAFGNSTECLPGEIPMQRLTLEYLSRFETLEQSFQKEATTDDGIHKYAKSHEYLNNWGASNTINIWSPSVTPSQGQRFSLSQLWVYGKSIRGAIQSAEAGWIVSPQFFPTKPPGKSVLFIYYTTNNYSPGSGCYNTKDCPGFTQTNSSVYLGKGFIGYSTPGGDQWEFTLTYHLYNGKWWLAYGSTWFGYYDTSIYNGGTLTKYSQEIQFGGEIDDYGPSNWGPMGSGYLANRGFGYAAFQRFLSYYNTAGAPNTLPPPAWADLTPVQKSPLCWSNDTSNNNANPSDWGTYMYFGGPGGASC